MTTYAIYTADNGTRIGFRFDGKKITAGTFPELRRLRVMYDQRARRDVVLILQKVIHAPR